MNPVSILLPGLDGTGELFEEFVARAPAGCPVRVLGLPNERALGYEQIAEAILPLLPASPFALIAESFSGPLAVLLANRSAHVRGVVLCATFVQSPVPHFVGRLAGLFRGNPAPLWATRLIMAGGDRELAGALRRSLVSVSPAAIEARIEAVLGVDVRAELARLSQPLLCLRATRDRLVPASATATIRAVKPNAEFADVNAPHLILQANPAAAWQQIAPFLERVMNSDAR